MRRFASLKDSVGPRKMKSQHLNVHQFYQQNESFEVFSTKKWQQQPILSTAAPGRQGTHFCALNKLQLQFLCWSIWTQTERVILNKNHETEVKQRRVISKPTPHRKPPSLSPPVPTQISSVLKENKKNAAFNSPTTLFSSLSFLQERATYKYQEIALQPHFPPRRPSSFTSPSTPIRN